MTALVVCNFINLNFHKRANDPFINSQQKNMKGINTNETTTKTHADLS